MGDSPGFWQLASHIVVSSLRPEPYTLCLSGEYCLLYAPIEIPIDSGTAIAVVMMKGRGFFEFSTKIRSAVNYQACEGAQMKVRNIMAAELVTLRVDEELSLASDIMNLARIRHLPIVEGERLVGIISQRDLFRASLASVMGYDYAETRDHLKSVAIKDAMVKEVITVGPDTGIQEAGRIMLEKKIGCLPVVEGDRLAGLVTETDILRCFLLHYEECVAGD
jgi:CBS domain-containing protein